MNFSSRRSLGQNRPKDGKIIDSSSGQKLGKIILQKTSICGLQSSQKRLQAFITPQKNFINIIVKILKSYLNSVHWINDFLDSAKGLACTASCAQVQLQTQYRSQHKSHFWGALNWEILDIIEVFVARSLKKPRTTILLPKKKKEGEDGHRRRLSSDQSPMNTTTSHATEEHCNWIFWSNSPSSSCALFFSQDSVLVMETWSLLYNWSLQFLQLLLHALKTRRVVTCLTLKPTNWTAAFLISREPGLCFPWNRCGRELLVGFIYHTPSWYLLRIEVYYRYLFW